LKKRNSVSKTQSNQRKYQIQQIKLNNPIPKFNHQLARIHIWPKYVILQNFVNINQVKVDQLLQEVKIHKMTKKNIILQGNTMEKSLKTTVKIGDINCSCQNYQMGSRVIQSAWMGFRVLGWDPE
jgi:hypothetical protein